ncbi:MULTISPECIES: cation acetate symporter [unclassified Pseudonocardia]|uniref:sodium/solute symporter n=1 Tax=unclassified Pseudonocardia TaxID=2619320 RepID=UPI0001FFEA36|nr:MULTISPECIES: cation acetate symporter [unclassified Pseudonocardia]ALE75467.1 sodium:solute symporter [Pseudonocardia sp. EC080625-04]ALL74836.1 sodium:solute symporter [Pseudonocardia sp. EC080610-09]ALL81859.1 sodium:solute symporter [Pseudonocardia sp. EC080619-01]OLM15783.1 putative transmembrane transport protein [Pseudonocardia sp. Ae707_Ps1]
MTVTAVVSLIAIVLVAVVSGVIGSIAHRTRLTSDFLVASRSVPSRLNAGAISGEYLSSASFLGIAGLILLQGVDALWYAVGYTAGYLFLLLFVAAPLRRSGAYTVPDFADARLASPALRRVCTSVVIVICWLYLLPQIQGAGLTLGIVTGLPDWIGAAAAGVIVLATVALGGMRSVTFVQAFQYWFKLTALAVPVVIGLAVWFGDSHTFARDEPPEFREPTTVSVTTPVTLDVRLSVDVTARGTVDGQPVDGPLRWVAGSSHEVAPGTELDFAAGEPVPVTSGSPSDDESWLRPFGGGEQHQLLATYSLILATFLGTMGLPHVLGRFYTNSDGRAARRSAVLVIAMLGGFYLLVTLMGVLSRVYTPQLLVTGRTDAAVLLLPSAILGSGVLGILVGGLVAAGAWAAFLSTASGLLVSLASVISTDVLAGRGKMTRRFPLATVLAGIVPTVVALVPTGLNFAEAVALVFAVAASTFCPLLILGIWWRGLTDIGAIAGVVVGGVASAGAVIAALAGLDAFLPGGSGGWAGVLLYRPAIVSVPLAFLTMVVVSELTRSRRPADAGQVLLRLHAPERLGLMRDRLDDRT